VVWIVGGKQGCGWSVRKDQAMDAMGVCLRCAVDCYDGVWCYVMLDLVGGARRARRARLMGSC